MPTLKSILVLSLLFILPGASVQKMDVSSEQKILQILNKEGKRLSDLEKESMVREIIRIAGRHHIDPLLIVAIMHVESRFDPWAASYAGAYGLLQIKPIVMREMKEELQIGPQGYLRLLTSKEFNIKVGVTYFSMLLKKFDGDTAKALMAYNRGPTAVAREFKGRSVPSGGYQGKVLKKYAFYSRI